jgi:hypothetical protein
MTDSELIVELVDSFGIFDDLRAYKDSVAGDIQGLVLGPWNDYGLAPWRPRMEASSSSALEELYQSVPGPFPPLYAQLILSYRWYEVDVGQLRLLSNLPPRLDGLREAIVGDQHIFNTLREAGFVQFGKGPDVDYDPVCFDLRRPDNRQDCPIVKFDHEEILCNDRLVQIAELAPTFRTLLELVVEDADEERRRRRG